MPDPKPWNEDDWSEELPYEDDQCDNAAGDEG